jgi:hypothetical protein
MEKALEITILVTDKNPDVRELQAKAIPVYLAKSKAMFLNNKDKLGAAFKCLQTLLENHYDYEKTLPSRIRFA